VVFVKKINLNDIMINSDQTLLYSPVSNEQFVRYIGIGGCEIDPQDPESYILPEDRSVEGWKRFFEANNDISPIEAMNFVSLSGVPEVYLPESMLANFSKHKTEIEAVIHNWFEPDSAIFKFLDLVNIDLSDDINEVIEISEFETKYHFKDGSSIIINENETVREQYFIPSSLQEALIEDLRLLPILLII
jgi:hypothetical protein